MILAISAKILDIDWLTKLTLLLSQSTLLSSEKGMIEFWGKVY